jgi:two-component system, NtrC family, sensor kinase
MFGRTLDWALYSHERMMEGRQYYKSLTRNMVSIMILVSFTPLVLIAGLMGYHFETSYRDKVTAHLHELVEKHQQNINAFLDEKLSYINVLADSYTYQDLTDDAFLQNKLAVLQKAYSGIFVDLGVIDAGGVQIAYAGNLKLERADYSKAQWFQEALSRNNYISDVFLGYRRTPHFIVAVKRQRGGAEWILRATIDFLAFNSLVENLRIGQTGSALIVNSAGEFQTRPRTEPFTNMTTLVQKTSWTKVPVGDYSLRASAATPDPHPVTSSSASQGVSGLMESDGKKFIYILLPLKGGQWTLAYQQEESDAFSEIRHARLLALAIFFSGGLAIIFMAVLLSRKVVKRIERVDQEKELMNEQVIEAGKLASIGELAAGIAHEINNPVAIMVEEAGWMDDLLLEEDLQESENVDEFKRALKQISIQGERCKEITHKLLSFARHTDPVHHDVQVNEIIEDILSIYDQRSKFNKISINSLLDPDLPLISASPSELQQVFMNLINNAIDAMGTSGGVLEIRSKLDNGRIVIDVADTGHGIPKAVLPRMFDPFFTTKPVGKGTGLGLSICYGIVKKLGGNITVNSSVGLGTTFHIYLPAQENDG